MPGESVTQESRNNAGKRLFTPGAEHNSNFADLSATSDLHNPNKISKVFAFCCHKHVIFSILFNVPSAV